MLALSCEVGAKAPLSSQQQVVKLQKIDLKPQSAKHDLIPHRSPLIPHRSRLIPLDPSL